MSEPWERYQQQGVQAKEPWERYRAAAPAIATLPEGVKPRAPFAGDPETYTPEWQFDPERKPSARQRAERVDWKSGAPASVRAAVGSAQNDRDRLATIRKFFPDAQPHENGNFIYTDPKTGVKTIYNPKGLDWEDFASVGPEVAEFLGGTAGGLLAAPSALGAAPATGGQSLRAVPVATGAGATVGRELYAMYAPQMLGTVDSRGAGERVVDAATTFGMNAVGTRAGQVLTDAVVPAVAPMVTNTGRTAAQTLDDFTRIGVRPTAGAVTGNRSVQQAEHGLSNTFGGAGVISRTYDDQAQTARRAAANLTDDFASGAGRNPGALTPETPQQAGGVIRNAANAARDRFTARQDELYETAFDLVGGRTPTQVPATLRLAQDVIRETADAPNAQRGSLGNLLQRTQDILTDAQQNGGIPFETLRRIRTDLGREIRAPGFASGNGAQQESLRRLYAALTDDIYSAARAGGPGVERALRLADRYTRFNLNVNMPTLEKIAATNADEIAYTAAMSGSKKGGTQLAVLRRNFQPEEWDAVAAATFDRLGQPSAGNAGAAADDFSAATFLTNYNKLAPEARHILFGGNRYEPLQRELDAFVRVMDRIKDSAKMGNPSGTVRNLQAGANLVGLTSAATAALTGNIEAGAGMLALVVGSNGAANISARMITNPNFVRWLTTTSALAAQSPASLPAQIARLATIGKINPEIREEIERFRAAINQTAPAIQ